MDSFEKFVRDNRRFFSLEEKMYAIKKQHYRCAVCGEPICVHGPTDCDADHIFPWSKGGKTEQSNCQALCCRCSRYKGSLVISNRDLRKMILKKNKEDEAHREDKKTSAKKYTPNKFSKGLVSGNKSRTTMKRGYKKYSRCGKTRTLV